MEGSDDELEDYVYDDSSNQDENIDIATNQQLLRSLCFMIHLCHRKLLTL